jgi:hypothetical protein
MPGTFTDPFEATSPWNSPIDTATAQYSSPTAVYNQDFRNTALGNTWLQADNDLFHFTTPESPVARWDVVTFNDGGVFSSGAKDLTTPTDIQFVHGTDLWSIFTDPDGSHFYEVWAASYNEATGTYGAEYMVRGDFVNGTGFGFGQDGAGIRAAGASLLGGVVTWDELSSGTINHALAIELSPAQLKAGSTQADQFVFPAVSADSGSTEHYTGSIPMGAHFALPPDVDIAAAGLTPEGATIAHAYQTYGGYVVDSTDATTSLAEVVGMPAAQADDFYNNVVYNDMAWLRDHLIMI